MILSIKNDPVKINKSTVRKAVFFFSNSLLTTRMNKKINLKIIFIEDFYKKSKCLGTCTWTDNNERPKHFEIELDANLSPKQTLRALAHEMVHLKQYATGQMKDLYSDQSTKWEGKIHKYVDNQPNDYWTYPWEIEAYGREVGLYVMFKSHLKRKWFIL